MNKREKILVVLLVLALWYYRKRPTSYTPPLVNIGSITQIPPSGSGVANLIDDLLNGAGTDARDAGAPPPAITLPSSVSTQFNGQQWVYTHPSGQTFSQSDLESRGYHCTMSHLGLQCYL